MASNLPDFLLAVSYVLVELVAERDGSVPVAFEVDADIVHSCCFVQVLDTGLHNQRVNHLVIDYEV